MPHQTGLIRHGLLLMVASQVGNVANLLFQVVMMRRLDLVEYGALAAMLSLVLITGTPLEALRTAVAHQTALLSREGRSGAVKHILHQWAGWLLLAGAVIAVLTIVFARPVATAFQLTSTAPVLVTGMLIAGSLFMPLIAGGLQGVQSFNWLAAHGQVWGLTRLALAFPLLYWLGATAMAGLWAQGLAVLASIGVGLVALSGILSCREERGAMPSVGWAYFGQSLFVLAGFAVIMNADVALVKRFFEPDQAGLFARAAAIGRLIVFLSVPIAVALFPKVASIGLSTAVDRRLLVRALVFTALVIGFTGLVCTVAVRPLWYVFTGESPDPATVQLIRWLIWALAPLGLTFLLLNFELAQKRFRVPALMVLLAALYVAGVTRWHESFAQVLTLLTTISIASLLILAADMLRAAHIAVHESARE